MSSFCPIKHTLFIWFYRDQNQRKTTLWKINNNSVYRQTNRKGRYNNVYVLVEIFIYITIRSPKICDFKHAISHWYFLKEKKIRQKKMQNDTNINTCTKIHLTPQKTIIRRCMLQITWKKILTRCLHGFRSKNYQCEKVTYTYIIGINNIRYTYTLQVGTYFFPIYSEGLCLMVMGCEEIKDMLKLNF